MALARIGNARRVENFTWPGFVDALATAFNAMGYKGAYDYANQSDIAALFVIEQEGDVNIIKTEKWIASNLLSDS